MISTEIEILNIIFIIAIALVFARLLGYLFYRLKQPVVIGEIISGIILGGIVIYFFSGQKLMLGDFSIDLPIISFETTEFMIIKELGILFLLFISGLEISFSRFKKTEKASSFVAVGGVVFPLVFGFGSAILLGFSIQTSVILGLILVATSVGVTVRTLMDLQVLDTDVGATILGSAVIDDVIGILLLAFVIGVESLTDALWIGLRIALFFLVFLYVGLKVICKILDLTEKIHLPKALLSISIAILLLYSFFADKAGISGIIGAFVAGVLIGQNIKSKKISEDVKTVGYGFFIPIFFVWVGTTLWKEASFDINTITSLIILAGIMIIISIIGKILGCYIGAKLAGMTNKESLQIGVGMIPRMELALIIVSAAVTHNLLQGEVAHQILVTTVLLTIVTTIIAPVLIKATFKSKV